MLHSYDNGARLDEPSRAARGRLRNLDAGRDMALMSPAVGERAVSLAYNDRM